MLCSEISPKFNGVPATVISPIHGIGNYFRQKNDITTFFTFFIRFGVHIQQLLRLKILWPNDPWILSQCFDCPFKSAIKLDHDILGFLNKSKTPGHCGFPLANPHKGQSLHYRAYIEFLKKDQKCGISKRKVYIFGWLDGIAAIYHSVVFHTAFRRRTRVLGFSSKYLFNYFANPNKLIKC